MSFARQYDRFREHGAEITAISVDSPEQNRAMIEKLMLPFTLVSDPDGDAAIKPYGLWDEKGRIAIPAIVAVSRDGKVRWFYRGRDFADRPANEDLFAALRAPSQ